MAGEPDFAALVMREGFAVSHSFRRNKRKGWGTEIALIVRSANKSRSFTPPKSAWSRMTCWRASGIRGA